MRKSKSKGKKNASENGAERQEDSEERPNNIRDDEEEAENSSEEKEYEVEKIVGKKKRGRKTEYLVRWKGFSESDDTWEEENNLTCPELIAAYNDSEEADDEPLVKATKGQKRGRPSKADKAAAKKAKKADKDNESSDDEPEVSEKEYEVEKVLEVHHKKNGDREFLVRWKGYGKKDDTWEPEKHLNCEDLIAAFMKKVTKAKEVTTKETRVNRKSTKRFVLMAPDSGRKLSGRNRGARRTYYDQD